MKIKGLRQFFCLIYLVNGLGGFSSSYAVPSVAVLLPFSGPHKALGRQLQEIITLAFFNSEAHVQLNFYDEETFNPNDQLETPLCYLGPLLSHNAARLQEDLTQGGYVKPYTFSFSNDETLTTPSLLVFGVTPQQQAEALLKLQQQQQDAQLVILVPDNALGDAYSANIDLNAPGLITVIKSSLDALPEKLERLHQTLMVYEELKQKSLTEGHFFSSHEQYQKATAILEEKEAEGLRSEPQDPEDTETSKTPTALKVWIPGWQKDVFVVAQKLKKEFKQRRLKLIGDWQFNSALIIKDPFLSKASKPLLEPLKKPFVIEGLKTHYNQQITPLAAVVYDCAAFVFEAIVKTKSNVSFKSVILNTNFEGFSGRLYIDESGVVLREMIIR